jgi:Arm domain-containing DNA-binding protein
MGNRAINRLTSKRVEKLLRNGVPGRYNDGAGLHLVIVSSSSAHWERRFQPPGVAPHVTSGGKTGYKCRYLGLGSARVFTLAEARERNRRISQQLADGIDPITQKRSERAAQAAAAAKMKTFGSVRPRLLSRPRGPLAQPPPCLPVGLQHAWHDAERAPGQG